MDPKALAAELRRLLSVTHEPQPAPTFDSLGRWLERNWKDIVRALEAAPGVSEDTERLDWLQMSRACIERDWSGRTIDCITVVMPRIGPDWEDEVDEFKGDTIREAIDAVTAAGRGKG